MAVASALHCNKDFSVEVDSKSVRKQYEQLQNAFNKKNWKNTMMSGVSCEVMKADELINAMCKAREEFSFQKNQDRVAIRECEQDKLEAGARVVGNALENGALASIEDDDNINDAEEGETMVVNGDGRHSGRNTRGVVNHGKRFNGEVDRSGALLK